MGRARRRSLGSHGGSARAPARPLPSPLSPARPGPRAVAARAARHRARTRRSARAHGDRRRSGQYALIPRRDGPRLVPARRELLTLRRTSSLLAAAFAVLLSAPHARAFEREWHLGGGLGAAAGNGYRLGPAVNLY